MSCSMTFWSELSFCSLGMRGSMNEQVARYSLGGPSTGRKLWRVRKLLRSRSKTRMCELLLRKLGFNERAGGTIQQRLRMSGKLQDRALF
jgi:hypothetical protein